MSEHDIAALVAELRYEARKAHPYSTLLPALLMTVRRQDMLTLLDHIEALERESDAPQAQCPCDAIRAERDRYRNALVACACDLPAATGVQDHYFALLGVEWRDGQVVPIERSEA